MTSIGQNLASVRTRIEGALRTAGRPAGSVALLAVSKGFGPDAIREALAAGQSAFGENYLQEALPKMDALAGAAVQWHFTGPLQSNKTRPVAERFDWAQTVDRLKIAERLSAQRPRDRGPLDVCVQVNVSGEATKSGCPPDEAAALCAAVAALPGLRLRGLMAIPAPADGAEAARAPHRALRALFERVRAAGLAIDTLSAGMSDDLEAAVAEGSTMVRVGTAIFGERQ